MSETTTKLRYFTLLIAWQDNDPEQGEFAWSGWAASDDEAETFARLAMADGDHEEGDDLPGGHVIDCIEGADCYAAPRAADALATLLDRGTPSYTVAELQAVLDLLRPPPVVA